MAHISFAFRRALDRNLPRPILGNGYKVEIWSRDAVRYTEGLRQITMFADLVRRTAEPFHGNLLARALNRLFGAWCLGIHLESPLVWDNEDTAIPSEHAALILQRIEAALQQRGGCYRLDRGPNHQHSHPVPQPVKRRGQ